MEFLFLVLALVGIAFAFQKPREQFLRLFRERADVEHQLGTRAVTEFHNDGEPLDSSSSRKIERYTVLYWQITNACDHVLQFEPGVLFRQLKSRPVLSLRLPKCKDIGPLFPNHHAVVLEIVLTPAEIEHLLHWVNESDALGLRTSDGREHWVPTIQYGRLTAALQSAALAVGLPADIPKGQEISVRFINAPSPPGSPVSDHHD